MVSTETLVGILLTLKDEASEGLGKAGSALEGLGDKLTSAGAKFLVITEGFNKLNGMIDSFFAPALNFEAALTRSKIAMKLNDEEAAQLESSLKNLSESAVGGIYSYEQTAAALQAIAAEGSGVEGSLLVMQNAMNLAASAGLELTGTTASLHDILCAWNLDASESTHISDVLLNTWRETSTSIPDLMAGITQSGVLMKSLGMSIEEATATIGVFKDVGIDGVNGLFRSFATLLSASSPASKSLMDMGISATDMAGNLKSPIALIKELQEAGLTATDILELFGIRGAPAMIAALDNISQISQVTTENLNSTGQAAKAGGEFANSAAAKHMKFEASVENLKETLAEGLLPALSGLFTIINPILTTLTKYPEIIYAIVGGLIAWKIATIAQTIAQAAGTVGVWASTVALLANPIVWIVLAIMALILVLYELAKNWDKVTKCLGDFGDSCGKAWNSFTEGLGNIGKAASDYFGGLYDGFVEWGGHMIDGFIEGIKNGIAGIGDAIGNIGKNIAKFIGFSMPPLFGPLHNVPDWGAHMVQSYILGIETEIPALNRALAGIAKSPKAGAASSYAYATNDNRQTAQTNNIYISGVDPEQIADTILRRISEAIGS